jgi:hypothetical protein
MDIVIEEPLNNYAIKLYQEERWRYPSMTDVKFFRDNHIIAAHRYGCKVYMICVDNNKHTVTHSIKISYNGKPYQTESFIVINNKIYMLSFSNVMTLIDILPDLTLKQRKHVVINIDKGYIPYHGIAFKDHTIYLTPSNKSIGTEHIITFDTITGRLTKQVSLGENIRVKALTFLPNDVLVVVVNYKEITTMATKGHTFNGSIRVYSHNFTLLHSIEVPLTHFDGIVSDGNLFYATGADTRCGYIYKGSVVENKITSLEAFQVHDFPHGIDVKDNIIAYTSYATSGIHFVSTDMSQGTPL